VEAELPEVAAVIAEAEAEAGDDKHLSLSKINTITKEAAQKGPPLFIGYSEILLLNWHIRSTHVSKAEVFPVSFYKQGHIIPGINGIIVRVNYRIITNFNYLVAVTRRKNFFGQV